LLLAFKLSLPIRNSFECERDFSWLFAKILRSKKTMKNIDNLNFSVADNWNTGFTGYIKFTNKGDSLDGWTLEFDSSQEISEIWGATIVSHQDNHYVVKNVDWNQHVAPDQQVSIGFNANTSNAQVVEPTNYFLDGIPLDSLTTTPTPASDPNSVSDPNNDSQFRYGEALQKSYLFYEAQRSGDLPDNKRLDWRGDSALGDGSDVGRDLTGGYFDAGDHVKFNLPMAYSMTMLGWGVEEFQNAYQASGQLDEALAAVKWGTDYFLKCIVTDEYGVKELYGQVGNGTIDHSSWVANENLTSERPSYKIDREHPGSDLAAETAAALTSASIIFSSQDSAYSETLLNNARLLYDFAEQYQGKYSDSITDAQQYYNSYTGYQDELAWGATWLYKATGEQTYLDKAKSYMQNWLDIGNTQSWDNKTYGTAIMLSEITQDATYNSMIENWLNNWVSGGNGVQRTEGGLSWNNTWGSLRYSSTTAMLAGIYSEKVNDPNGSYSNFAREQIDYILGNNPRGASYMVGFGNNYPLQPHHQTAHGKEGWDNFNNDTGANAHIIYGAMVGGPKSANDFDYQDVRTDYVSSEVALDYNAGLTGALAYMYSNFGGEPLSDAELDSLPEITVSNT
jgi:endoglucanase